MSVLSTCALRLNFLKLLFNTNINACFEQFGWRKTGEDIQITWDRDVREDESASSDEELAGESGCESVTSPKCRESGDGGQTVMVLLILWHH